jgi:hypothetical protein
MKRISDVKVRRESVDGMVLSRRCSGISDSASCPVFGTHVQLNVTGLYHLAN